MVWLVQLHRIQLWVAMPVKNDDTEVPSDANDGTGKPSCTKLCVQLEVKRPKINLMIAVAESDVAASALQPSPKPEAAQPSGRKHEEDEDRSCINCGKCGHNYQAFDERCKCGKTMGKNSYVVFEKSEEAEAWEPSGEQVISCFTCNHVFNIDFDDERCRCGKKMDDTGVHVRAAGQPRKDWVPLPSKIARLRKERL